MKAELKYADIIDLPHHISKKYPRLSREQHAGQYAPFAALTGYSDDVKETARLIDKKIELDDCLKEIISNKLNYIDINIKNEPVVTITYFIKDTKKSGGKYEEITEKVRKINIFDNYILLYNNVKINIPDILDITGEIFKGLEY